MCLFVFVCRGTVSCLLNVHLYILGFHGAGQVYSTRVVHTQGLQPVDGLDWITYPLLADFRREYLLPAVI